MVDEKYISIKWEDLDALRHDLCGDIQLITKIEKDSRSILLDHKTDRLLDVLDLIDRLKFRLLEKQESIYTIVNKQKE